MKTIVQHAASATPSSSGALPEGFVKVQGGTAEQVTETTSLIVAYSAIWLILMALAVLTLRATRSLRGHAERAGTAVRHVSHTAH